MKLISKQSGGWRSVHWAACALGMAIGFAGGTVSGAVAGEARATADAWPMFRGEPSLTGISPAQFLDEPQLLWTHAAGGAVRSSAAIVEGRVYVGSDSEHLHALDLKDGKEIWKYKAEDVIESSPLVLNGVVYFGSGDGMFHAVNAADGTLKWKFQTDDQIIAGPNWIRTDAGQWRIVVGSHDFFLYCLDAETGKKLWSYESTNFINGCAAVADGVTAFGGCDALLHVIDLAEGKQVREIETGAYIGASIALTGQRAYLGHYGNEFLAINLESGETEWKYADRQFPYFSSPAVTKDRVLFGGRDKRMHCLDRATGKPVWTFPTRGRVDSSPVVVDGRVVFGSDDGRLYLLDLESGKETWSYEIGGAISTSPAVIDHTVVIGSQDGNIYCFGKGK